MRLAVASLARHTAWPKVHRFAPSKAPSLRIQQLRQAGELQVPFTTGLLIGIGETQSDRLRGLELIAHLAEEFGHIQEVILQPHSWGSRQTLTPTSRSSRTSGSNILLGCEALAVLPELVRAARSILPPDVTIQIPPNLFLHSPNSTDSGSFSESENWQLFLECLENGAQDLGGISPRDEVNPDFQFPAIQQLQEALFKEGYILHPRLPVYPRHFSWLSARVAQTLRQRLPTVSDFTHEGP
ncbi:unnamed protein product [Durusdinium trenchii]|uniref:7,8-didemethyl-8-hydroxy-5-deazariboflavin synthase n=1 Tax=Durusdinium trenchii TaxID=1381693 RepID=A0ABP0MI68_9DINO